MKSRPSYPDFDSWIPCNGNGISFAYNPNMPFGDSGAYYMVCRFGQELDTSYPSTQYQRMGFELEFTAYANQISVEEGHYMVVTLAGDDVTYVGSFLGDVDLYFSGLLYDSNGRIYSSRTSPVINTTNDRWQASLLFRVGDDGPCTITKFSLRSNMPSTISGSMYYDVNVAMLATVNETEAQRLHNEVMEGISSTGDKITANQDKNTNSLLAKLQGVLDSILQLPQKIWEKISEGLKALFVPDSEYISGFRDRFDTLLSDRFGGVYQAAGIIDELLVDVNAVDKADDTISLPVTKIPLPGNHEFSFGGYQVDIIPAGLENLLWYVKLAVGIVATILFINILRILYDEVMGVEDQR